MTSSAGNGAALANRLVLLGASNLTLSLRLVIDLMQRRCGAPSDVLVAAGHGRSFGRFSRVLARGLPGIVTCDLWPRLAASSPLPTLAFITDVGNDIAYGHEPDDILEWVGTCVERLRAHSARIVMTALPISTLETMSEWHFKVIRSVFFPFSRLPFDVVRDRARIVQLGLEEMAAARGFDLCAIPAEDLGPDVIHVLYWRRRRVYAEIIERLPAAGASDARQPSARWSRRPRFAESRWFAGDKRHAQPSGGLTNGTVVSLY